MDKENENRDIDLQKIQILSDDFQALFNVMASLWVGGLIGLLILISTVYYNKQFSSDVTANMVAFYLGIAIVYVAFTILGRVFLHRGRNEFFVFVDNLYKKVEKGDSLPSLMKLKKRKLE